MAFGSRYHFKNVTDVRGHSRKGNKRIMAKKISIVILNYENWQDTLECLESVFDITYHPYRIIVVDNDSKNRSLDEIDKWLIVRRIKPLRLTQEESEQHDFDDNPVVLIQSASNNGYSAGNNIGIRWAIRAQDDYVLILNNDTLVEKGFLEPLAGFLDTHPDAAMVGPKILDLDGKIERCCARRRPTFSGYFFRYGIVNSLYPRNQWARRHKYIGEYDFNEPKEVGLLSGACMLIRSRTLRQMGCLDEATFLFQEEAILCERLRSFNKKTFVLPASTIRHKIGSAIKSHPTLFMLKTELDSNLYYLTEYREIPHIAALFIMNQLYLRYYLRKLRLLISR